MKMEMTRFVPCNCTVRLDAMEIENAMVIAHIPLASIALCCMFYHSDLINLDI